MSDGDTGCSTQWRQRADSGRSRHRSARAILGGMYYATQIPSSAALRKRIARRQVEIAELRALLDVARTRELAAVAHGLTTKRPPSATVDHDAASQGTALSDEAVQP